MSEQKKKSKKTLTKQQIIKRMKRYSTFKNAKVDEEDGTFLYLGKRIEIDIKQ